MGTPPEHPAPARRQDLAAVRRATERLHRQCQIVYGLLLINLVLVLLVLYRVW